MLDHCLGAADGSETPLVGLGRLYGGAKGEYQTQSADGLSTTIRYDTNGNGLAESQVTDTVTLNTDGSKVETISYSNLSGGSASSANPVYTDTLKEKAVITTSANGLTTTSLYDLTGSGTYGESKTDVTALHVDGSTTQTLSTFAGATLKSRYALTESADGLSTTAQWDRAGTGTYTETATKILVKNANGSTTETVTSTGAGDAPISKIVTTISADGRTTTIQKDMDGNAAYEEGQTITKSTAADGSTMVVTSTVDGSGGLINRSAVQVSADGRTVTTTRDANGDGIVDQTEVNTTFVDGSSGKTLTDWAANGSKAGQLTSTTSAEGLLISSSRDLDGDGIVDRTYIRKLANNADGSPAARSRPSGLARRRRMAASQLSRQS